jgi:hypothetical protein
MQSEILYQHLAHGAEVIQALIGGLTQAEAGIRPEPASWSILEVMCHLLDEEREDFRQCLDIILHHPEAEWPSIDPRGWVTTRQYNERNLSETLDSFLAEREKSLSWLRGLSSPDWEAEYTAPFGSIKAGDMLSAWAAHDILHTRQLVELRYSRLLNLAAPYGVRYAGEW